MKTFGLLEFFEKIGYDWTKDEDQIKEICRITKTRVRPELADKVFTMALGMEQAFLLKAVSHWKKTKKFFEIGTGRGTGSYSVALNPSVEKIITVDVTAFRQKQNTAIGYQAAYASNADLNVLIPGTEKEKIEFVTRGADSDIISEHENSTDLAFIDGDHTNHHIILNDYRLVNELLVEDGICLWDDYCCSNSFAVSNVVDSIVKEHKELDTILVEFRGHLFDIENKEKDSGVVIMKMGKIFDE